jgi:hypothetical protein
MFKVNLPKSILENNESDKVENNNYKKFVGYDSNNTAHRQVLLVLWMKKQHLEWIMVMTD